MKKKKHQQTFVFDKSLSSESNNPIYYFCWTFVKILLIFVLILYYSLISNYNNNKNNRNNIDEIIEKQLSKVEPNYTALNWKNIKKDFEALANKYSYLIKKEKNIEEDSPIWVMWYQGIETAPPIVKACIQSVIVNRAKHPVHIISKYNLEKYVKLPSYLMEKFNNGTFSITHFSDIIRFALLHKYGGYWIDSTYFVTTPLTKLNSNFFSLRLKKCWLTGHPFINCQWAGNFLAVSKRSFIATYAYMAFLYYWKKYNSRINFYLIDYIIFIAYSVVPEFKDIVNNLPIIDCSIFALALKLKSGFSESDFNCPFNKLKKIKGKNITNYDYIIENYKLEFKNDSE